MTGVVFSSDGSQQRTTAAIGRLGEKAANPEPVLLEAREILTANEAAVFDSSGGSIGEAWESLSETTVEQKHSDRILVMTGTLRAALTNPANVEVEGTSARLNARGVPYAHFHVSGTSKMPARPFLGLSVESQRAFAELMQKYMAE